MTQTVLVVDPDLEALSSMSAVLADAGYSVARGSSFKEARQQLVIARPDVLITAVRLGRFNGLDLVIRGRASIPDIVAIVTHPVPDPVLQDDATARNAVWLVKPFDPRTLLDLLARMLRARRARRSRTMPRRWPRKRLAHDVAATLGVAQGVLVDVSYGGLRLRMSQPIGETPRPLQRLAVPVVGLVVGARPVWTRSGGPDGPWWYGIEVDERDSEANQAWRAFVDEAG